MRSWNMNLDWGWLIETWFSAVILDCLSREKGFAWLIWPVIFINIQWTSADIDFCSHYSPPLAYYSCRAIRDRKAPSNLRMFADWRVLTVLCCGSFLFAGIGSDNSSVRTLTFGVILRKSFTFSQRRFRWLLYCFRLLYLFSWNYRFQNIFHTDLIFFWDLDNRSGRSIDWSIDGDLLAQWMIDWLIGSRVVFVVFFAANNDKYEFSIHRVLPVIQLAIMHIENDSTFLPEWKFSIQVFTVNSGVFERAARPSKERNCGGSITTSPYFACFIHSGETSKTVLRRTVSTMRWKWAHCMSIDWLIDMLLPLTSCFVCRAAKCHRDATRCSSENIRLCL